MKLDNTSEFASWVIDLRDGALQIQRVFRFPDELSLSCFMIEAGRYMKSPNLEVMVDSAHDSEMSAVVTMSVIPERIMLAAAGDLAKLFEGLRARITTLIKSAA